MNPAVLTRSRWLWADDADNGGRFRIEADQDRVVGLTFDVWHHDGIEPNFVGTFWTLPKAYAAIADQCRGGDAA